MESASATVPQENIRDRLLVARLPALPQTLFKLLTLCQSDDVGMAELAELIAKEPGLCSRLLSVAHSAAYHRTGSQLNLLQAANTLGTEMIKVLVISQSVFQTLNTFSHAGSFDLRLFWKHSLTTAMIAKALAVQMTQPCADEAYLVGLLHDVGRLALLAVEPHTYASQYLTVDDGNLCNAEQSALGISHTEAGAWLLEQWKLDDQVVEAVLYHHEDLSLLSQASPLTGIVHLAHRLASWVPSDEADLPDIDTGGLVDALTLAKIMGEASIAVIRAATDLGIDISDTGQTVPTAPPVVLAAFNPAQNQIAQEVRNRTLLTEMSQSLARHSQVSALLTDVRLHAAMLLGLDDAMLMLLTHDRQTLESACVPTSRTHWAAVTLRVDQYALLAKCLQNQQVVVSDAHLPSDTALCQRLASRNLIAIALRTAKHCLGIVLAAVPDARLAHLKNQTPLMQAFGRHAGDALSHLLQTTEAFNTSIATIKHEQQVRARQMAHEVNNPLGIIKNYLAVIDDKLDHQQTVRAELSIIEKEIDLVNGIVEQFTESAPGHPLESIDVIRLVHELMQLLQASRFFPAAIELSCQLPDAVRPVMGSADMIKQILINLIKNARECLPQGGRIVVGGGDLVDAGGQSFIKLTVADTGPGLAADMQAQLFEPVRSSKSGRNHGLGLSIVSNLVRKMNGLISYHSDAEGTSFDILLPCAQPKAAD